jgi:hypothetical protein
VKVLLDEEQHWQNRDTEFYDSESVIYRVDPKNPAVAGFLGAGRVTIDHAGPKLPQYLSLSSNFSTTGRFPFCGGKRPPTLPSQ